MSGYVSGRDLGDEGPEGPPRERHSSDNDQDWRYAPYHLPLASKLDLLRVQTRRGGRESLNARARGAWLG
jgi:hypothetical protein